MALQNGREQRESNQFLRIKIESPLRECEIRPIAKRARGNEKEKKNMVLQTHHGSYAFCLSAFVTFGWFHLDVNSFEILTKWIFLGRKSRFSNEIFPGSIFSKLQLQVMDFFAEIFFNFSLKNEQQIDLESKTPKLIVRVISFVTNSVNYLASFICESL